MTRLFDAVVDADAPALVTAGATLTWRALQAQVSAPRSPSGRAPGERVGLVGDTGLSAVVDVIAALEGGATPVLGHPRWPAALRDAAFARAGVGRGLSSRQRSVLDDDSATIVFTSGSSGPPKAVLHRWAAHAAGAAGALLRMPFGPGDRWLLSLPVCHVGGLALIARALHAGGAIAVPETGQGIVDAVVSLRPTHVSVVATQLRSLLSSPSACGVLRSAKVLLVGGGPTPAALWQEALAADLPVRQTWGLTEMGSQVCTSEAGRPSTCGRPLPGRAVRVTGDGELVVSGAGRFTAWVDGDEIQLPFDDDGGYATGDLGRFDDDGLVIVGRKDFRFISGGENVQPEAVADVLADARLQVFIVPIDDERFGQRPFCFYDGAIDDDDAVRTLRRRADAGLPRFMHPVGYARLPATTGTKPRRADLMAVAAALHQPPRPGAAHGL